MTRVRKSQVKMGVFEKSQENSEEFFIIFLPFEGFKYKSDVF